MGTIEEKDDGFSPDILRKRTAMLSSLYQISRAILKESEIDSILNLTANTILGDIKAERVYILMKDEELGSIKTALARDAGKISGKEDKLMLSRTVINRVMDEEISC